MSKELCFSVQSTENYTHMISRILFEKSEHYKEYNYLWHHVFDEDSEAGDALFAKFLVEVFPEGTTLGMEEFNMIMEHAVSYLKTEYEDFHIQHLKDNNSSWVYSKYDKKLILCKYLDHENTVIDCCCEFFKGMAEDNLTTEKVKKFILSNFEIKSENTTLNRVTSDATFITRCICIYNEKGYWNEHRFIKQNQNKASS